MKFLVRLEVSTHSTNEVDIIEVEYYDPEEINSQRNDQSLSAVLIGKNSYSRIDLKNIKVLEIINTESS